MGLFKKESVTLKHYKLVFKTIDNQTHEYNYICYVDENCISCSALEYYLIGQDFLQDDKGNMYPIQNIISIEFQLDDILENCQKQYSSRFCDMPLIFYPTDKIKKL